MHPGPGRGAARPAAREAGVEAREAPGPAAPLKLRLKLPNTLLKVGGLGPGLLQEGRGGRSTWQKESQTPLRVKPES